MLTAIFDLSSLVRYVEDALLQRVDAIRERWLIFDSFRKAHSEARIKTEQLVRMACETFEEVCGSEKGLDLWRYAAVRTLERGQVGRLHCVGNHSVASCPRCAVICTSTFMSEYSFVCLCRFCCGRDDTAALYTFFNQELFSRM